MSITALAIIWVLLTVIIVGISVICWKRSAAYTAALICLEVERVIDERLDEKLGDYEVRFWDDDEDEDDDDYGEDEPV
jgi:hypothetical protein